ncbi:MAG: hypothetical protein H0V17_08030, partial [Deltaproteobacteria bacterium]|nr:hypothetical protein [Deltaproteobacteria bacterium]
DGSELSQAVITRLGARAFRGRIENKRKKRTKRVFDPDPVLAPPLMPEPMRPAIVVEQPELAAEPKPAPKLEVEPIAHPIQNLVDAIRLRLTDLDLATFELAVENFESPLLAFSRGKLCFAGGATRLHAIANALRTNSPWAPLAVDAVIAHAVTVLDEARSEVNAQTVRDVLAAMLVD